MWSTMIRCKCTWYSYQESREILYEDQPCYDFRCEHMFLQLWFQVHLKRLQLSKGLEISRNLERYFVLCRLGSENVFEIINNPHPHPPTPETLSKSHVWFCSYHCICWWPGTDMCYDIYSHGDDQIRILGPILYKDRLSRCRILIMKNRRSRD